MKNLFTFTCILLTALYVQADDAMEREFLARFESFIAKKNLENEQIQSVWLYGDMPTKEFLRSKEKFESTVTREIESMRLIDIYPQMKAGIEQPFTDEGVEYVVNVEPYKMLEVVYKQKIEGDSDGWSNLVGISNGKLYFAGYKQLDKSN